MIWSKSTMAHLFYDNEEADEHEPCLVSLEDGVLVLEYDDEDSAGRPIRAHYRGAEQGEGHFQLACVETGGKATLHRFPGASLLEGSWTEGGYRGMWRITLKT